MKWDAAAVLEKFPKDGLERLRGARRTYVPPEESSRVVDGKVVSGDFRARVLLPGDGRLGSEFAADLGAALANKPVFRRMGQVCCVVDGKLAPVNSEVFRGIIERWVVCRGMAGRGENRFMQEQTMTKEMAAFVVQQPCFLQKLREVRRVVPLPVPLRGEGGRVVWPEQGYHAGAAVWVESALKYTEMTAWAGLNYLENLLADFPWARGKEVQMFSNQLSAMLAVYCDLLVEAGLPRPVFIYPSNAEGSGKTLLIRAAICPVFGPLEVKSAPETYGDEIRKVLTTEVIAGSPYICFDNFRNGSRIENPAIEAFATGSVWTDRMLGAMERVSGPRDALLFLSGNNCKVGGDMRRRSLFVELFLDTVASERRTFASFLSERKLIEKRVEILSALRAIVMHWDAIGQPTAEIGHGSYREWGDVVGAMVECLGLSSPLEYVEIDSGGDTDMADMEKLLAEVISRGSVTAEESGDVAAMLEEDGRLSVRSAHLMAVAREMGLFASILSEDEPSGSAGVKERALFSRKILGRFVGRTMMTGVKLSKSEHASRAHRRYYVG